jgi:hypothetical protein
VTVSVDTDVEKGFDNRERVVTRASQPKRAETTFEIRAREHEAASSDYFKLPLFWQKIPDTSTTSF